MKTVTLADAACCANYLRGALHPELRKATIEMLCDVLSKMTDEFDSIVVSGISGLLVGPSVADILGKNIIVVRKGESTHSHRDVEGGTVNRCKYVIIDDLHCTGATLQRITEELDQWGAECIGAIVYFDAWDDEPFILPNGRKVHAISTMGHKYWKLIDEHEDKRYARDKEKIYEKAI